MRDDEKNKGQKLQKNPAKKKRSKGAQAFFTIAIIICLGVMAFSGYKLITTALEYKKSQDEYKELQNKYAVIVETPTPTPEPTPQADSVEAVDVQSVEPETVPVKVDWENLKLVNEDIVAWIYIGALKISYPVVHYTDNDFYLRRTVEKTWNMSGSIFVEAQNNADFNDPNTIIYGHNMLDGSMFSKLPHLADEDNYKKDPYIWIFTPTGNYKYKMFSLHRTAISSEVYTLFTGTDETFTDWCNLMQDESQAKLDQMAFTADSRVITLSTCTDDSAARYVVQAVRVL